MLDAFLNQPTEEGEPRKPPMSAWQWTIIALLVALDVGTTLGALDSFRFVETTSRLDRPVWRQPFWTDELKAQLAHKLGLKVLPKFASAAARCPW